jgi:hypothetical protein
MATTLIVALHRTYFTTPHKRNGFDKQSPEFIEFQQVLVSTPWCDFAANGTEPK